MAKELEEIETRSRAILKAVQAGIMIIDPETHTIVDANKAALDMIGLPLKGVVGRKCHSFTCPAEEGKCPITDKGQKLDNSKRELLTAYGKRIPILKTAVTISLGGREHLLESFVDISKLEKALDSLEESESRARAIIDTTQAGIMIIDPERHTVVDANEAALQMIGQSHAGVVGKTCYNYFCSAEKGSCPITDKGQKIDNSERELVTRNGGLLPILKTVSNIQFDDRPHLLETFLDITKIKETEVALRKAEESYRTIFENAVQGIYTTTSSLDCFEKVNDAMATMLGYASPEEMLQEVHSIRKQIFADPAQRDDCLNALFDTTSVHQYELEMRRKDGSKIWVAMNAVAVRDEEGKILFVEGLVEDITRRRANERELERKASLDELTGLANRYLFRKTFDQMLAQAKRSHGQLGVFYIDLDSFKEVNDMHGHHVGDALLKEVAKRLKNHLRSSDQASRLGGDEFAALLWDVQGDSMQKVAQNIIDSINKEYHLGDGIVCRVGASIGASMYPVHGDDPEELLRRADLAMYEVKQNGKNQFVLATM